MKELKDWIKEHEGFNPKVYKCSRGFNTIGWGHNLDAKGITRKQAEMILDDDIAECKAQLESCYWYLKQPDGVKKALIDMCFNLGIDGLLKFNHMISALYMGNYQVAADEAQNSLWAKQVPNRAKEVIAIIRDGK